MMVTMNTILDILKAGSRCPESSSERRGVEEVEEGIARFC
tara:strand:- start:2349 stop:2468 length:120 start_codon:yes stop_codon:yes gene_type:complete